MLALSTSLVLFQYAIPIDLLCYLLVDFFIFPDPRTGFLMAGISFKKEKEKIFCQVLLTIKAGITSQPVERDFKGDVARKKIEVV